jgi:hypothetical protein
MFGKIISYLTIPVRCVDDNGATPFSQLAALSTNKNYRLKGKEDELGYKMGACLGVGGSLSDL